MRTWFISVCSGIIGAAVVFIVVLINLPNDVPNHNDGMMYKKAPTYQSEPYNPRKRT